MRSFPLPIVWFFEVWKELELEEFWQPELIDPGSGFQICHVETILMYPFWCCSSIYHLLYHFFFLKKTHKFLDWAFFLHETSFPFPLFSPNFLTCGPTCSAKKKPTAARVELIGLGMVHYGHVSPSVMGLCPVATCKIGGEIVCKWIFSRLLLQSQE